MVTYILQNVRDGRILAKYYEIDVPEGQGRFPLKRLKDVATANGDTIVVKDWQQDITNGIGQQRYHVEALVQEGHAKVARETIVTLADVRAWARLQGKRGRVSTETIARATAAINHWNKADIVSVNKIE